MGCYFSFPLILPEFIKGVIVISVNFSSNAHEYIKEMNDKDSSMEIELIDGKKLKKLCEKCGIIILNGKI